MSKWLKFWIFLFANKVELSRKFGLVYNSSNLPKGQAGKSIFFDPWTFKWKNSLSLFYLCLLIKFMFNHTQWIVSHTSRSFKVHPMAPHMKPVGKKTLVGSDAASSGPFIFSSLRRNAKETRKAKSKTKSLFFFLMTQKCLFGAQIRKGCFVQCINSTVFLGEAF